MLRPALVLSIALFVGAGLLGGCGQTGALYLPNETPPEDIPADDDETDADSG
ncbi:MAG: lipoprotein [Gammaproteobacteria bacterium]